MTDNASEKKQGDGLEASSSSDRQIVAQTMRLSSLPLGFQKITVKPLMSRAFDLSLFVRNQAFHSLTVATKSVKPISKILDPQIDVST